MVVPDSLSRGAVDRPLCQRCFCEIEPLGDSAETAGAIEERFPAVSVAGRPSAAEMRDAQERECTKDPEIARNGGAGKFAINEQDLLHTKIRGRNPIVVSRSLVATVLSIAHGSRLCGHYDSRRTQNRIACRF